MLLQLFLPLSGQTIPVIFLTDCIKEREMNSAIKKIEKLDAIDGKVMRIRMETFG